MPTKKKTPAKKTASKKAPAKKSSPAKSAAKRSSTSTSTSTRRTSSAKSAPKKPKAEKSHPVGPREEKLANEALKLVDQAATLLRRGIRSSASTTEKARHDAKQQAHSLLNQASSSLVDAIKSGTTILHKGFGKL